MRLFIAEKPSLARAIADVLPGPHKRNGAHIQCGDGNVVAWCAGHILQTAPPEAYGPEYKSWSLEHLPIAPRNWQLTVSTPDLLKSIKTLLKEATRVVHAGDPDREGQLLVDEVLGYLDYRGPVDRLLIADLNPEAVRRSLDALEPNEKYRGLSHAALARQRADWLFGMNLTRLYTLLGRQGGYDGVLSVGRVQTPLLGLIVDRDRAIETFRPVPYYAVSAAVQPAQGATFKAQWVPSQAAEAHLDPERRLLDTGFAEAVRAKVHGQPGRVTLSTHDEKSESPPLPYSLSDLQVDAARRLGLSAQAVLDACQALYETHRLTTYPRSDCSYLPEGHHPQATDVLAAIAKHSALGPLVTKADGSLRTKAWNDKKITAHHAIIPTPAMGPTPALSPTERGIYDLICRRYLALFYPPHVYLQAKLELEVAGERFGASGRTPVSIGWKAVLADVVEDEAPENTETSATSPLPKLAPGERVVLSSAAVTDKRTQPPKPFTDATLIQAMCNIARFVSDPGAKKLLTETDGIGTNATRAAIIETLLEREYVVRVKKAIVSTPTGRALAHALPDVATTPDISAVWEAAMRAIIDGSQTLDAFLGRVSAQLDQLIHDGRALGHITVGQPKPCPKPACSGFLRRRKGQTGTFLSCSVCRTVVEEAPESPKHAAGRAGYTSSPKPNAKRKT